MESQKKVWIRRIVAVVVAYFFPLSLNHIISLWGDGYATYGVGLFGYNVWAIALYIFAVWILYRMLCRCDKRLHVVAGIVGLLLSMAIVYGSYAHFVNDIFKSSKIIILQIKLVIGFWAVTMPLSEELILLLDRLPRWCESKEEEMPWAIDVFFQKRKPLYFVLSWIIIFASYIPVFLAWWPGNFVYDAPFQLAEVIYESYETHHPLIHTLLMGWAYNLGLEMGDVSTGYQFYTLIQMLVLSGAFAYCGLYLYKKRAPRVFRIGAFIWFAWFPMHAIFSITATKDIMFAAFFLCFAIFLIRLLYEREQFKWYSYAGMIVSGVLSMLMRNNAVYAVLAGGLMLLLFEKGGWKPKARIAALLAGVYVVFSIANAGLVAAVDAKDTDSYRETLSVPLQCLARVAAYRSRDLDKALYDEICMYIPEEEISGYNPYLADNIKSVANEELLRENFANFVKLCIKVGMQFPDEYIESIVTNTMGYWYPLDQGVYTAKPVEFYHKQIWISDEIEKKDYCTWANEFYGTLFWQEEYRSVPVLGYLFRIDGWVWFLNFYLAWCIYKKDRNAGLMGAIPFMYMMTCYLGPVPILRYIYCLIVTIPLLLYMIMRHKENAEGREVIV